MRHLAFTNVHAFGLGLLCFALSIPSSLVYADSLDNALVARAEKEKSDELKSGTFNSFNLHATATGLEKEKLSDQKKAELATAGLAESVAASHQNQHTIAHGSNSVSQISPKK